MNRKRLRILAQFLRGIDRKHFHLGSWCHINGGTIENGAIKKVGCGTTACAMGWATSIPSFRRAGLKLIDGLFEPCPVYRGSRGIFAAQKFFDSNMEEMRNLFATDSYLIRDRKNPGAVIKRIEAMLDE